MAAGRRCFPSARWSLAMATTHTPPPQSVPSTTTTTTPAPSWCAPCAESYPDATAANAHTARTGHVLTEGPANPTQHSGLSEPARQVFALLVAEGRAAIVRPSRETAAQLGMDVPTLSAAVLELSRAGHLTWTGAELAFRAALPADCGHEATPSAPYVCTACGQALPRDFYEPKVSAAAADGAPLSDENRRDALARVEVLRAFSTVDAVASPRHELRQVDAALLVALYDEQAKRIRDLEAAASEALAELESARIALPTSEPTAEEREEDPTALADALRAVGESIRAAESTLKNVEGVR
jgi:DNA-binding Lrp family transcriptional regulator